MIELVALGALFAIAAPYALYPLLLWARAARAGHRGDRTTGAFEPCVDLIICAHDEERSIASKIENALGLDYPPDRLAIWVASDGSSDGTVRMARAFEHRGVRVLELPRVGKARALTAAVEASSAEIIAFSDANSMWRADAMRALMRPLADPSVGGVAGDQRYSAATSPEQAVGERSYWSFDRQLKRWQESAGSVISATGAIYAIRRELFAAPPPDATDDFMISTGVVVAGKRLAFAPDAVAIEPPSAQTAGEFRRKVRITTRGLRAVGYRRELLNPSRSGFYALELLLHKLWRRLGWIPLLVLTGLSPWLWQAGGVWALLGAGVVGCMLAGLIALAVPALERFRFFGLAGYVVMVNAACAIASLNALRGHRVSQWDSARGRESLEESPS